MARANRQRVHFAIAWLKKRFSETFRSMTSRIRVGMNASGFDRWFRTITA